MSIETEIYHKIEWARHIADAQERLRMSGYTLQAARNSLCHALEATGPRILNSVDVEPCVLARYFSYFLQWLALEVLEENQGDEASAIDYGALRQLSDLYMRASQYGAGEAVLPHLFQMAATLPPWDVTFGSWREHGANVTVWGWRIERSQS